MQPLAFAENGRVRVGTGSGMTGLRAVRITLMRQRRAALSCGVRTRAKGGKAAPFLAPTEKNNAGITDAAVRDARGIEAPCLCRGRLMAETTGSVHESPTDIHVSCFQTSPL